MRAPQPGAARIRSMLVTEDSFEDEDLFTTPVTMARKARVGRPAHERHVLGVERMQWENHEPGYRARQPCAARRLEDDARAIVAPHLVELHEDRRPIGARGGSVRGADRVPQIRSRGVLAVLIDEEALQNEDLLAASMGVLWESGMRRVANDARRPRVLSEAIELHPLDAGRRCRNPRRRSWENDGAFREIDADAFA